MDNLKMLWSDQHVGNDSFCKLKAVKVKACPKLTTVFPSNVGGKSLRLDLHIADCSSMEEIFNLPGSDFEGPHSTSAIQLRTLYVSKLPKLKHLWNKEDPRGSVFFDKLRKLTISHCASMTYIFPAYVARSLLELEYFLVHDSGVEEIVAKENGEQEEIVEFVFPQMITLRFLRLPDLQRFYVGKHTLQGPALKKLSVYHCDNIMMFPEEFLGFQGTDEHGQLDMPVEPPLFFIEQV